MFFELLTVDAIKRRENRIGNSKQRNKKFAVVQRKKEKMNAAKVTLNFILCEPRNTYILFESLVLNGFSCDTTKKTERRILFSCLEMLVSVVSLIRRWLYWSNLSCKCKDSVVFECAGGWGASSDINLICYMNQKFCGINIKYNDLKLWLTQWQTIDAIQINM